MSDSVLTKEIGDDIRKLQMVKGRAECTVCPVIRDGLIRALRTIEALCRTNRINTLLLVVVVLFGSKVNGVGIVELLIKMIGGN
jgi:hypothetical protein